MLFYLFLWLFGYCLCFFVIISYVALANHAFYYYKLKNNPEKIYLICGQKIKWWYFLPCGYLFNKDLYGPKSPKL